MRMVERSLDKAGTYIATYMVVPKDKSDSYTITRKVTLTDTEGRHIPKKMVERNRSQIQNLKMIRFAWQNYTDVEIETSEEDASARQSKN